MPAILVEVSAWRSGSEHTSVGCCVCGHSPGTRIWSSHPISALVVLQKWVLCLEELQKAMYPSSSALQAPSAVTKTVLSRYQGRWLGKSMERLVWVSRICSGEKRAAKRLLTNPSAPWSLTVWFAQLFPETMCACSHIQQNNSCLGRQQNENYTAVKIIMAGGCYRIIIFSS